MEDLSQRYLAIYFPLRPTNFTVCDPATGAVMKINEVVMSSKLADFDKRSDYAVYGPISRFIVFQYVNNDGAKGSINHGVEAEIEKLPAHQRDKVSAAHQAWMADPHAACDLKKKPRSFFDDFWWVPAAFFDLYIQFDPGAAKAAAGSPPPAGPQPVVPQSRASRLAADIVTRSIARRVGLKPSVKSSRTPGAS